MHGEAAQAAHARDDDLPSSTVNKWALHVVTHDKLGTQIGWSMRIKLLEMFGPNRVENHNH
jgi:hypothetical protein